MIQQEASLAGCQGLQGGQSLNPDSGAGLSSQLQQVPRQARTEAQACIYNHMQLQRMATCPCNYLDASPCSVRNSLDKGGSRNVVVMFNAPCDCRVSGVVEADTEAATESSWLKPPRSPSVLRAAPMQESAAACAAVVSTDLVAAFCSRMQQRCTSWTQSQRMVNWTAEFFVILLCIPMLIGHRRMFGGMQRGHGSLQERTTTVRGRRSGGRRGYGAEQISVLRVRSTEVRVGRSALLAIACSRPSCRETASFPSVADSVVNPLFPSVNVSQQFAWTHIHTCMETNAAILRCHFHTMSLTEFAQ